MNKKITYRLILLFLSLFCSLMVISVFSKSKYTDIDLPSFTEISRFVNSNRYTQVDSAEEAITQEPNPESVEISTDMGTVYVDEEALSFQFFNENSYLWSSTVDYDSEEASLNKTWQKKVRSAIWIESYNSTSTNLATFEEYVLSDGTTKTIKYLENGFESRILFGRSRISLLLRVSFTSEGIIVEVPFEEIKEGEQYKLSSVTIYPFFGAVLEDSIPGYVFVPDGVGALVRYQQKDESIISNYQKEIYGRNPSYNIESNLNYFTNEGSNIYAPVYGFVHGINQNAIFAHILESAEYGSLNINYAGKTIAFTTVFPKFVYRRTYRQPTNKAGGTISLIQKEMNYIDIKIQYHSLVGDDANYIGMAKTYRDSISKLKGNKTLAKNIPLKLETIGLERTEGLVFDEIIVMTKFSEFNKIINDLKEEGIDNLVAVMSGITKSGTTWSAPNYRKISSRLGRSKDLRELIASVNDFYFLGEFVKASSKGRGYSEYSDLAKKINDQIYQYQNYNDKSYLLIHQKTLDLFRKSTSSLREYGNLGFALPTLGNLLYADFKNKVYLEDAINLYQDMLKESEGKVALYNANDYLFTYIDAYFDFPMYSSQYLQFTDTVPFLAIALRGELDLFGANANFYAYARDELLRLIDYGIYPSFIITENSSRELQETPLEYIYTSQYRDLRSSIITYYDFVNKALKYVINQKVIAREVIQSGCFLTRYENGIEIIVNYNDNIVNYQGIDILEKNYLVMDADGIVFGNYQKAGDRA